LYELLREWGFTTGEHRVPREEELRDLLARVNVAGIVIAGDRVTIPVGMALDFGAIAKGYAGDMVRRVMVYHGVESAIFSLGGDVIAVGQRRSGSPWRVALRNPFGEGHLGIVEVIDQAVSTSGSYERWFMGDDGYVYHHILDPLTGRPADSGLVSVTVVATEGVRADALSTALFVMGPERGPAFAAEAGVEAIFVTVDGSVYATGGLAGVFMPEAGVLVRWR